MPNSSKSWIKPGLRYCTSCLVAILYWIAWITLSTTLVALLYVLFSHDLAVPDFMLRRAESRLAEINFTIKFGRARFDPSGKILLENVEIRSPLFEEPLLTSRVVHIRRSFWSILAGRPIPDEIVLEGATLQIPAIMSPSGGIEPLVRDLATVLRHDDQDVWHLDQLTGRVGRLMVNAHGEIGVAPHRIGTSQPTPQEMTAQFLKLGRKVILEASHLEAFDDPILSVTLTNTPSIGNSANCRFTATAVREPWAFPVTLGPIDASSSFRLDGTGGRVVRVHARTDRISFRNLIESRSINATADIRISPEALSPTLLEASIEAGSVSADQEKFAAPMIHANLRNWPTIKASLSLQAEGEFISSDADIRTDDRSATIRLEGTGASAMINRMLNRHTPRAAPYFVFGDPVAATAEVVLTTGWHFASLSSRVDAGRLNSRQVMITSARGRIDIVGSSFLAYDAKVEMGTSYARGSYWMDFMTSEYRMLLKGRLRPPQIGGWFNGDWWGDFWNAHFEFPTALPEGDVDVIGQWRDGARTEYFGLARAEFAKVWGGRFDQVQATIFLRPHFTHILNFRGRRGGDAFQYLGGSLKRFADPATREGRRIEFDLDGNVDPETYHGMLDGKADDALANLVFSAPPHVHANGALDVSGPVANPDYVFKSESGGALTYYGFPIDAIQASGRVKGQDIFLDAIKVEALGGMGAGKAALTGTPDSRSLGFDLYLNGADLARSIRAVLEYQAKDGAQPTDPTAENNLIKRVTGGRLDVALSAQGTPGKFESFVGTGNAAVTGAELGEIQLFGLLSQVLSGFSLNFSSLKLDSIHTSFRMENGRLSFPDLKVTGPSAVIDARGDFVFATRSLDFKAKFKPFEESHNLLTAAIGAVIYPITSILELRLTGPLKNPNWSIDLGSSLPAKEPVSFRDQKSDPPGTTPGR